MMLLALRMFIYVVASQVGGAAFIDLDPEAMTVTIDLEGLGIFLGSLATVGATFVTSRFAKKK